MRLTNGGQACRARTFKLRAAVITDRDKASAGIWRDQAQADAFVQRYLSNPDVMALIMIPSFLLLRGARSTGEVSGHCERVPLGKFCTSPFGDS